MESNKKCPKCNASMDEGFVVDHSYGGSLVSKWSDGPPEESVWTGLKVKDPKPITTYRCTECGYLESYANNKPVH